MIYNYPPLRRRQTPPASELTLTLSGKFSASYGYVEIDGVKYTSAQTLSLPASTKVTVYCGCDKSYYGTNAEIYLNGTSVAEGTYTEGATYTFTLTDNCTINFSSQGPSIYTYWTANITMPA